ncbi:MAG: substrate-binding domain-containing protein, partial [Betaproteobacteria bacterium]|nr:substrate-binding domain-containing protein [Betaproteobacteria bacterium]
EDKFVADGHGINRRDVMYNDFILVGPPDDPAKVAGLTSIAVAMQRIARSGAPFVSRGDDSGTEKLELRLWAEVGISPKSGREPWYFSAGTGMGEVLMLSGSKQAYTLSDRATYAAFRQKTGLRIVVEGDAKLFNPYGVIAVNPARHPQVQFEGAMKFIDWLTSAKGQQRIADFKVAGAQMFFPSASGSR